MRPSSIACLAAAAALFVAADVNARSYILVAPGSSLPDNVDRAIAAAGGTVTQSLPQIGVVVAESASPNFSADARKIAEISSVLPDVMWQTRQPVVVESVAVSDDAVADAGLTLSDIWFPLQWGHSAINSLGAWEAGQFGAGVLVAVLDSGIAANHGDLAANVNTLLSKSFVPGEAYDFTGTGFNHGTHVAGTIAAVMNTRGVVGVAPQAKLVAVKVLSASGGGAWSWLMSGLVYTGEIGADVANISLGGTFPRHGFISDNGTPSDPTDDFKVTANELSELVVALGRATQYAYAHGTTLISSAGNDHIDRDHDADLWKVPADCPHVIAVAATAPIRWAKAPNTTPLDTPASYSNYGQSRIDFAAPGGDNEYPDKTEESTVAGVTVPTYIFDMVFSTSNRVGNSNVYSWAAGTSMAAPHVTGVAALIIGKNGGSMHPAAVEAALRKSADDLGRPGKDDFYGHGRVNAAKAVQ